MATSTRTLSICHRPSICKSLILIIMKPFPKFFQTQKKSPFKAELSKDNLVLEKILFNTLLNYVLTYEVSEISGGFLGFSDFSGLCSTIFD